MQVGEDVPVEVEVPKVKQVRQVVAVSPVLSRFSQVKTEVVELSSDEEDLVEVAARRYLRLKEEEREAKRGLKTLLLH